MQFIYRQGQNLPANMDFQRGWNMIMSLYGNRMLGEREQRIKDTFKQEMDLREKTFNLTRENKDLENKQLKLQLSELERIKKQHEDYRTAIDKERTAGTLTPQKQFQIWQENFPEKAGELMGDIAKKTAGKEIEWSAPKEGLDEKGNPIVYRVSDVGEIDILQGVKPTPKSGMKIYDREGNLIVDTSPNAGGKTIPAAEVGKTGEFKAYAQTLDQIQSMIKQNKIDTGPFEFIREKVDNWGIATNNDRIALRALVARLPGLMYAMRGKQLSDRELEVAMRMMPKMNTTEDVFINDTKLFADYMNKILTGKKEAFEKSGYNAKAFENENVESSMDNFWE